MTAPVKTEAQLEALFFDNNSGSISAFDGRILISSTFGYSATTAPTVNNDKIDTAGIGQFFDTGSRWTDTATNTPYFCVVGTPGAAVWVPLSPAPPSGPPPVGTVSWYLADGDGFSGLPIINGQPLNDGETGLVISAIVAQNNGPWVVHPGAWTRPSWYSLGTVFSGPVVVNIIAGVNNIEGDANPCLWWGAPWTLGQPARNWTVGTDRSMWTTVGTGGIAIVPGTNVIVSPTGFQPTNVPSAIGVGVTGTPTFDNVTLSPEPSPGTPNTLFVDSTTNELTFIDSMGTPHVIAFGGGSFQIKKYVINFSDFTTPTPLQTIVLDSFPAGTTVLFAGIRVVIEWDSNVQSLSTGFQGGDPTDSTELGAWSDQTTAQLAVVPAGIGQVGAHGYCPNTAAGWQLTASLGAMFATLVQGQSELILIVSQLPW